MDAEVARAIRLRYEQVLERIALAARISGRKQEDVHLLVVTKNHSIEAIRAVIDAGARQLGENYAEEALPKILGLAEFSDLKWHMIGHTQSRKAGIVVKHFDYMHSVDSIKLAQRLSRLAQEESRILPVMLECNVSGEESKFGFQAWDEANWDALAEEVRMILPLPGLEVRGLMTMAPFFDQAEPARPYYKKLRRLQHYLNVRLSTTCLEELSMGMSGDFPVAIEEGATWVRIGTSILGTRPAA